MSKKVAFILENDHIVDKEVERFLGAFPNLYDTKETFVGLRHSSYRTLSKYLLPGSMVVFNSTFLYRDQLEDYVRNFAKVHETYDFYVCRLEMHVKDWLDSPSYYWEDRQEFLENVKKIFEKHTLYSFSSVIEDEYRYAEVTLKDSSKLSSLKVNKWIKQEKL